MKTTVYLCLGTSEYEHNCIGPIFSDEDDAKKWVELCKKLKSKMEKEHEQDSETEKWDEITKKYKKLFGKIDGDMYADDYDYVKKTINSITV